MTEPVLNIATRVPGESVSQIQYTQAPIVSNLGYYTPPAPAAPAAPVAPINAGAIQSAPAAQNVVLPQQQQQPVWATPSGFLAGPFWATPSGFLAGPYGTHPGAQFSLTLPQMGTDIFGEAPQAPAEQAPAPTIAETASFVPSAEIMAPEAPITERFVAHGLPTAGELVSPPPSFDGGTANVFGRVEADAYVPPRWWPEGAVVRRDPLAPGGFSVTVPGPKSASMRVYPEDSPALTDVRISPPTEPDPLAEARAVANETEKARAPEPALGDAPSLASGILSGLEAAGKVDEMGAAAETSLSSSGTGAVDNPYILDYVGKTVFGFSAAAARVASLEEQRAKLVAAGEDTAVLDDRIRSAKLNTEYIKGTAQAERLAALVRRPDARDSAVGAGLIAPPEGGAAPDPKALEGSDRVELFASLYGEKMFNDSLSPTAQGVMKAMSDLSVLRAKDVNAMTTEQKSQHQLAIKRITDAYPYINRLNAADINAAKLDVSGSITKYVRGESAVDLKQTMGQAAAAIDSVIGTAILSSGGFDALLNGTATGRTVPLTDAAMSFDFNGAVAAMENMGRYDVAAELRDAQLRVDGDLKQITEARRRHFDTYLSNTNLVVKGDVHPSAEKELLRAQAAGRLELMNYERSQADLVRRGGSVADYNRNMDERRQLVEATFEMNSSTILRAMASENPIFGRRGDNKIVWNWEGIMAAGGLALALYGPFERRESERRARRYAERQDDKQWERLKEQMALQNDYRLQQIGAAGEASRGGGSVAAVRPARF